MPQVVLTIGGSDSGGGAGIQADLKTFSALGLHGTCAVTAITAQNTLGVQQVYGLEPDVVTAQMQSITDDFSIAFAKTGMLHTADIVAAVAHHLQERKIPVVLDPVIEAEAGGRLLRPEAVEALKVHLIPLASVVTPNIFEAQALTAIQVRDRDSAYRAAQKILQLGPKAVIVKGGHLDCTDILVVGEEVIILPGSRVAGENHGVGCTYSAALTSFLAMGSPLKEAARKAKKFAERALLGSMHVGKGVGPVSQVAHLRQEASRYRVLCEVQEAADLLLHEPKIFDIIAEAGSSLGMAVSPAKAPEDVAFVEGGLIKEGREARQSGCVRFGGEGRLTGIILAAMSFDPKAAAAMNISPLARPACRAYGLVTMVYDPERELQGSECMSMMRDLGQSIAAEGNLPDAIWERGCRKDRFRLWLLGPSALQVARQAVSIAGYLRDGKI
ncbi:MAG: bifunctional hydroxymethylpyrimidine kinase/phosphomethylpyrimidine kinase [Methanotrichaceae archaeon]|nr:bifunctional hydroxymethylpyrimidine kinase/phosphomethylpyrimidine kinase [Methanotrichaceae archaeon]